MEKINCTFSSGWGIITIQNKQRDKIMTYIMFNVDRHSDKRTFTTLRGAKIARAAANKNSNDVYEVVSVEEFESKIVKMVEKTNLLSGEKFMERSDTPYYCSPSSETFWSA